MRDSRAIICDMSTDPTTFKVCSSCRRPIGFGERYYRCSVSTCNRGRTALYFCSVDCFTSHVPVVRHRDAWAEQERAPTREQYAAELAAANVDDTMPSAAPHAAAKIVRQPPPAKEAPGPSPEPTGSAALPRDVLVVVSKLKAYVRARSDFNTSDGVVDVLSDHLRALCDEAIREAGREGRKTVLDRDVTAVLRRSGP
jgi:hypothetical protein